MLGPRFSLKSLLGAVTFVGVAVASLLQPWGSWFPALVLTGTLVMLLLSIPASIYSRARVRAFYVGFAAVGWSYFLLAYGSWFEASISRQLLAYQVAESVCFAVTNSLGDFHHFLNVIHAGFMFVLAYLGGLTASRFYVKNTEDSSGGECDFTDTSAPVQDYLVRSKELFLRKA